MFFYRVYDFFPEEPLVCFEQRIISLDEKFTKGYCDSFLLMEKVCYVFYADNMSNVGFSHGGKMKNQTVSTFAERNFNSIIEKCIGCERIVEESGVQFCKTYMKPEAKWRLGICNFATHAKPEINIVTIRVNPLKAAKRASAKGKK